MSVYEEYIECKKSIDKLKLKLMDIEEDIWRIASEKGHINLRGSKTHESLGFKITITHKDAYKVDQEKAATMPELFRLKYEVNSELYKKSTADIIEKIDRAITITPMKPGFKVSPMIDDEEEE
jgi:predicted RNA-binding protein